jgi:hypothetical protein
MTEGAVVYRYQNSDSQEKRFKYEQMPTIRFSHVTQAIGHWGTTGQPLSFARRPEDHMGKSIRTASLAALAVAIAAVSVPAMAQDQDHEHRGGGDHGSQQQGGEHRGNQGGEGGGQRQPQPAPAQVRAPQAPAVQQGGQQGGGHRGPAPQQGQFEGRRGPGTPQQQQTQQQRPNGQNPWADRLSGRDGHRDAQGNQAAQGRGPDGRGPDGRGPDGRGPDGRGPDGRGPGGRGPDGRGDDQTRRGWEGQQHQNGGQYRDQERGRYGYQGGGGRQGQNWSRDWHRDSRYDWNRYRNGNRDAYRLGRYSTPYRNWGYRRLNVGFYLQPLFYSDSYWIGNPYDYRLPPAYGPYRWVRYYNDALLVNIYNGEVVDTVYDIFW